MQEPGLCEAGHLGGPVVPDEESTTPPDVATGSTGSLDARGEGVSEASSSQSPPVGLGGAVGHDRLGSDSPQQRLQAGRADERHGGVKRGHPQAGGHRPQHGRRTGQGVGDRHGHRDPRGEWSAGQGASPALQRRKAQDPFAASVLGVHPLPQRGGLPGDQRSQTFADRSDIIPEATDLAWGEGPGRDSSQSGSAPPCQYIIRGSE